MPGLFTCPERPKSFVPRPPPRPANHAPPRATIDGTAQSVSTLLITVGLPQRPASTGNGGRGRGSARPPPTHPRRARASPPAKAPAPPPDPALTPQAAPPNR